MNLKKGTNQQNDDGYTSWIVINLDIRMNII
jgi:hypothetical protein